MILFSLLIPGFSADQETALLGYGIFTDQLGNTSWLMLAKDFQSMLHKNMLALSVNFQSISVLIILNISVILMDLHVLQVIVEILIWTFKFKAMWLGSYGGVLRSPKLYLTIYRYNYKYVMVTCSCILLELVVFCFSFFQFIPNRGISQSS